MNRSRRILSICCIILFLFFAVAASFEVAHAAGHCCSGSACPVCAGVRAVQTLLQRLCFCAAFVYALSVCGVFRGSFRARRAGSRRFSPVRLKVRLLN